MNTDRKLYVPAASRATCQRIASKAGDVEGWTWTQTTVTGSRYGALVFVGKARKPALFGTFRTVEARREYVARVFANAAAAAARREATRAEAAAQRAKPHALAVGDVLRASWGYDQTNIDYYEVTRLVGTQMVEIRPIAGQAAEDGWLQGDSVPAPGRFTGDAKRYRVSTYGARDSVRIASYANAHKVYPRVIGGLAVFPVDRWTAYA